MFKSQAAARYALIFATDCDPSAIYRYVGCDDTTEACAVLATRIGNIAEQLRKLHVAMGRDFYPVAFVEQAAAELNRNPQAIFKDLCAAGQRESDSIAA